MTAIVKTATTMVVAFKIFKKKAIIVVKKETAIMMAKIFKKSSDTSFNIRKNIFELIVIL